MTDTLNSRWLNPPPDGRRFAIAMGVGLLLELGAFALLLPVLSHQEPPAETQSVVKLSIVAPPPTPKPPTPPKPTPIPPKPVTPPPPPMPVAPPIPMPPPPPVPRPAPHVLRHYVKPRVQTPPPITPPPVVQTPPTPPPPEVPPAPSSGQVDLFRAAIIRAVHQDALLKYPAAAQLANESGTPEIRFTYLNGVVTNVVLAQSCGFPLLDNAALEVVRDAAYPTPPANFANHSYTWTIGVIFEPGATNVDGD